MIKCLEELKTLYNETKDDKFTCQCENCGKKFYITRITVWRKMNANTLNLKCKSCNIKDAKAKEDKIAAIIKRKQTCLEKYGCENTWQLDKVKEISSKNWPERKEKIEKTMLEKYGTIYCTQNKEILNRALETAQKNDPGYKKRVIKIKKTNLKKRGHESNFQDNGFRDASIEKMIDKYGRIIYKRTYVYNDICFDSSWELAYYIWLKDSKIEFEYQPKVDFKYMGNDGKEHNYYPDFYCMGEYQEIKGNQFFNEKGEPYDTINKKFWWEKYNCAMENKVHILKWTDLKPILTYIKDKYGSDYLKSFKVKI